MTYDLVIRGGTVVDGSGLPRYRADVAVVGGRIARIGRVIHESGIEEIEARGSVVAPGFIDGHTHMDAQVAWDPLGTCSCWHGVTSVVMGNCGFTLAPCRADERHLVLRNLERAEDIPAEAMEAGIEWTWETYAQYLDAVARWPKGINYAGYVGHSALRTYVMGERAFAEPASVADLNAMKRALADAVTAGAMGLTTSRTRNHETTDRRPVASRVAAWDEVRELVGVLGTLGAGIFEIAGEDTGRDPERARDYLGRLRDLAVETGVPVTWGMFSSRAAPDLWRAYFDLLEETARGGGRMFAQVHSRALSVLLSFETRLPFDRLPEWREVRRQPLDEQRVALRDPEVRRKLVAAAGAAEYSRGVGAETRRPEYEWIFLMEDPAGPHRSVADLARERGQDPVAAMIDLAMERDLRCFFVQPLANENLDHVLEMMRHPRSVVTFSDSGAHVSQIMDSSLQTHVLAYWVRRRQALTLEEGVRMLTLEPASAWGLHDRGLLREGMAADIVVFDPDRVAPDLPEVVNDLPAGARRLRQKATGFQASVVNGQVVLRDGKHTGAFPGRLLRGPLARSA
ncbi:MAG TPA: amidohydrolase family protein [Candidatus Methylomirabilis sp.]|nr:amidohydrolase family protein [Candidatus Methylomirabilis sp.]